MRSVTSLKDLRAFTQSTRDEALIEAVDSILSVAYVVLPTVFLGPAGLAVSAAADLLEVKGSLLAVGRRVLRALAPNSPQNAIDRLKRMQSSYCLITYVAYFGILDDIFAQLSR